MVRNGSRMVARSSESISGHAAAILSPLGPVPRQKDPPEYSPNSRSTAPSGRYLSFVKEKRSLLLS
ncbi:MAG: hypothetical protein VYC97_07280, partial [SAR324 cluster bacterium]|nr:hypothetical protein [SAR324 cluster bacterium]